MLPKLIVLTGAGISVDSGLMTFRDSGGLWENFNIEEIASIEGWYQNKKKVLDFYNKRRIQAAEATPNRGHIQLAELENYFDVTVITQNVDDLHERAGSSNVIHLHGMLNQARSEIDDSLITTIGSNEIQLGDTAADGNQLRPNVVWFGEPVPAIEKAIPVIEQADIFAVVGTSLSVYPAANLIYNTKKEIPKYLVDPSEPEMKLPAGWVHLKKGSSEGLPELAKKLYQKF